MNTSVFETEYDKLNKEQKEAVDTIEGPVMVVAGPGTGKTQVLALRIANILKNTDIPADGILCLTFTNSGVKAMKDRLWRYVGAESTRTNIFTFHSFGLKMIEEYYPVLGLDAPPKLLDDHSTIVIFDHLLSKYDWQYLRPRSDGTRYFRDLKSLISLLKRDSISPNDFAVSIEKDIEALRTDKSSISTRGESKGEIKKEVQKKIESLSRTLETVEFYKRYEKLKKEENLFDYDDVLENLVHIAEYSDDARDDIKERFLYVLVDEHQDSSRLQNNFLERVWGKVEKPNICVVGDDRQLIYGFGGASLEYFEGFKHTFEDARLITLTENYRSTQNILDVSHTLLTSKIVDAVLLSQSKESHPLYFFECDYERDEIIMAGLDIKKRVAEGLDIEDCAILVPKNRQVASAVRILKDLGIKASSAEPANLFDTPAAVSFLRVLKVLANPFDAVSLSGTFFDVLSGIPPLAAHKFLREQDMRKFSLDIELGGTDNLFAQIAPEKVWLGKLKSWLELVPKSDLYGLVQAIGDELLIKPVEDHDTLAVHIEVVRTMLHLVLLETEREPFISLADFIKAIERMMEYGVRIPLAIFARDGGVKIMTLHASKGLEFDYVWIAHMDEGSFERGKKSAFVLPQDIASLMEAKDEEVLKRELYVALTRAKRFCSISYARFSYEGRDRVVSHIVSTLTDNLFEKVNPNQVEEKILKHDKNAYTKVVQDTNTVDLSELIKIVKTEYTKKLVSVSLLNNFFECPWKWYFRNLLQLPEPLSPSLDYGNKVHNAIDKILKSKSTPDEEAVFEYAQGDEEVAKVLSKWVEMDLPNVSIDRENEKSVSVKDENFPHLTIYGKIDLVEKLGTGNLAVTDFKTGGPKKKSEIEKADQEGRLSNMLRQLAMYSYLLSKNQKWDKEVSLSRLLFLETTNTKERYYDTHISEEEIDMLIKDIKDYDALLGGGEWVARPCNFNSYGKQNVECEYCKMAKIYKY